MKVKRFTLHGDNEFVLAKDYDALVKAVQEYITMHDKALSGEVSMRSAYAMSRLRDLVPQRGDA